MTTIIFDLGGVYFTDGTSGAIKFISDKYLIDKAKVAEVFRGEIGSAYRECRLTHDEYWQKAKAALGLEGEDTSLLAEIWLGGYEPIDGTVNIIEQLKKAGHELIFLSDNVQERVDYLENKYHFLRHFNDGVFSHIAGVRKPNPRIYELALHKAANKPENCIFIDDKAELLEPAKKLGMGVIHFISPEELLRELQSYGAL